MYDRPTDSIVSVGCAHQRALGTQQPRAQIPHGTGKRQHLFRKHNAKLLADVQASGDDTLPELRVALRQRLALLREELDSGGEPDLESWLQTLELMKMYDRWFRDRKSVV